MIPSPTKHKQKKTAQQQIRGHLKKVDVSRFRVVSNEAIQVLNSVAVNNHCQNTPRSVKQWTTSKLMPVLPSWKHLETNDAARTSEGPEYKVPRWVHKKKDDNELESLKIMQSAIERYLKEKNYPLGILRSGESHNFKEIHRRITQAAPSNSFSKDKEPQVWASTTEEWKALHYWFRWRELNFDAWSCLFSCWLQNCLFLCYALMSFRHMSSFCIISAMYRRFRFRYF